MIAEQPGSAPVCWWCAALGAGTAAGPAGRILVLERFRRLLAVNRDLFLRSLLLEAVFVAFTALSSRQGELVLAANAILLTYFTAAAYGLDGFAHAAEAMVGRAVGARDRPGFRAAVRASFSPMPPCWRC